MEDKEMSIEESDALLRQELYAEDDSTINDEDTETEEETQEEETEEDVSEIDDELQEEQEQPERPKKWIAKVLSQRNEARKQAEEAQSEVQRLQERLQELEESGDYGNEEYVQTLVQKELAKQNEVLDFFEENEDLKSYRKDILKYSKENGLNLDKATKLYLAENNPELLLSEQTRNKQKAKMYDTDTRTPKSLSSIASNKPKYTDDEFEKLAKSGKIQF